jgi:hypothetical protein
MFKTIHLPKKYRLAVTSNFFLSLIWIGVGVFFPIVNLSENQTLYIFSSIAQVVAGIYGLTLAGYVFLSNQQDRLVDKDDSLIEIVGRIQASQHRLVMFITILSVFSIFASLITIGVNGIENYFIKALVSNGAISLFISAIIWAAYFVADVTRPEKISEESQEMKDEISGQNQQELSPAEVEKESNSGVQVPIKGESFVADSNNLAEFIRTFNRIDEMLETYADKNLSSSAQPIASNPTTFSTNATNLRKNNVRWTIPRIVKALAVEGRIDKGFADELAEIIRYRNALVHGQDLSVDKNMLVRVTNAFNRLYPLLG